MEQPGEHSSARAVVLLSGGLDSTTCLACARRDGFRLQALTFDYGQKNRWEFRCAETIARRYAVEQHRLVTIDLAAFGDSSLTSGEVVEKDRSLEEIGQGIPRTYVPARNTIFLSYALAWAEVLRAGNIYIGVNAVDSSGYPDCRPEFIAAYEEMANRATRLGSELKQRIRIHTPLIDLAKKEIIELGKGLGVDYSLTSSCYDPTENGIACGRCDACILRQRGFYEAGAEDPVQYVDRLSADYLKR